MEWLRLYTEITDDRKLRRLSPSQRWLWIAMMCIARRSPVPGVLLLSRNVPVNIDDLTDIAAIPIEDVKAGIQSFKDQEMLQEIDGVYHLVNWDKRQFSSDNSTDRVKRYRKKKKQENETEAKRFSTVSETPPDTDTESDPDPDQDLKTSSHPDGATPPETQNSKTKPKPKPQQKTFGEDSPEYKLANLLRTEILKNLPSARVPRSTPKGLAGWSKHIDLMIRIDNRDPPEIERLIRWCQQDRFWRANILSTKKLREKWETIVLQSQRRGVNASGRANPDKKDYRLKLDPGRRRQERERDYSSGLPM